MSCSSWRARSGRSLGRLVTPPVWSGSEQVRLRHSSRSRPFVADLAEFLDVGPRHATHRWPPTPAHGGAD